MDDEKASVGPWAKEKLACLGEYLNAYTTILRKQKFEGYFYLDAFAGQGRFQLRVQNGPLESQSSLLDSVTLTDDKKELNQFIDGSPRIALNLVHPFTHYVFIEKSRDRYRTLSKLKAEYDAKTKIYIKQGNCTGYMNDLIPKINWRRWRAFMFIDPYGMHVPWQLIEKIAGTHGCDVLLNFPLGMAIQRLLRRDAKISSAFRSRLDTYFGVSEWYDEVYEKTADLVGTATRKRSDGQERLLRWYLKRLNSVFRFVSNPHLVKSTSGHSLYYLILCTHNQVGLRIANDVLSKPRNYT